MPRLLTQAQFARKTKYSRARISQLVKTGIIQLKKGRIDPAQANAAIEANIDRSRRLKSQAKFRPAQTPQMELLPNGFNNEPQSGHPPNGFNNDHPNGTPSLTDVRRDHELLKMKKTEIEIKQRRSELVPKGEAIKWLIALGSAVKLAFLNLPRRLAETLKTLNDEKEIEILLRFEIQRIIHDLLEQPLHAKHKRPRRKSTKGSMGDHLETSR